MDTAMLRRVARNNPRARAALREFGDFGLSPDWCDRAAETWKQVTGNAQEAAQYRMQCLAPGLEEPSTPAGRGMRRLPWNWSPDYNFTKNPPTATIFNGLLAYEGAKLLASSVDSLIASATSGGAAAVSSVVASVANQPAQTPPAQLRVIGTPATATPAAPAAYAPAPPVQTALAIAAEAASKRKTMLIAGGVGVVGVGLAAFFLLGKKKAA